MHRRMALYASDFGLVSIRVNPDRPCVSFTMNLVVIIVVLQRIVVEQLTRRSGGFERAPRKGHRCAKRKKSLGARVRIGNDAKPGRKSPVCGGILWLFFSARFLEKTTSAVSPKVAVRTSFFLCCYRRHLGPQLRSVPAAKGALCVCPNLPVAV